MTTTTPTRAGTPPTSTAAAKVAALALSETRLMLRNRTVAVSSVFLPIAMGALFAYTFRSNISGDDDGGRALVFASLVAAQLAVVVGMTVYVTATQTVVARRHSLVLKRMRTSGLPDAGLLVATLTPCVVIALVQLLLFVPFDVYLGVTAMADPLALVLAALGGLALALTAAMATTAVTATPERAQITTLPMVFVLLGAAIAAAVLPVEGWWTAVAAVPGASIGLLVRFAFLGGAWEAGAGGLPAVLPALVALVAWPVVFGVLARRSFRWEPRR
jgi:ABC-2 type transport system permease protein